MTNNANNGIKTHFQKKLPYITGKLLKRRFNAKKGVT